MRPLLLENRIVTVGPGSEAGPCAAPAERYSTATSRVARIFGVSSAKAGTASANMVRIPKPGRIVVLLSRALIPLRPYHPGVAEANNPRLQFIPRRTVTTGPRKTNMGAIDLGGQT